MKAAWDMEDPLAAQGGSMVCTRCTTPVPPSALCGSDLARRTDANRVNMYCHRHLPPDW